MEVQINWLAVVLAGFATMVVSSIWYAPFAFGGAWQKLLELDKKKLEKNGFKPIAIAAVLSFVTAYVLAHFIYLAHTFYGGEYSFLSAALITAFWAGLGFSALRLITHYGFECRPGKAMLLNSSHELVVFMAMGLVIGLVGV